MTTLFTAIFYLWLVLSILLAAMWFLREQDRRRKDQQETELADELLTATPKPDRKPEPKAEPVSDGESEAEPGSEPDPGSETEPGPEAETIPEPDPESEAEPEPEPEPASGDKAEAEPGPGPEPEPEPASSSEAEAEPGEGQTEAEIPGILDILDGITLPHELTPLTARIEDPNRHAIFISPNPDAAEVGTAFADELVDRGFDIEAAGFDQAMATRGPDVISMRISPDAGSVADGNRLRYPSAQESDVAIEIWLGNGSPPPLTD